MLCRLLTDVFRPLAGWGLCAAALLAGPSSWAQANVEKGSEGLQARLFTQVRQSVAQSQRLPLASVEFAPLDPRVQLQDCSRPLAIDLPFASRETVRVRCTAPAWQLYLRLQSNNTPPVAVAVGGTASGSGAASQGAAASGFANPALRSAVVARQLIQRGAILDPSMFEEVSLPAQGLEPQAVSSLRDLLHGELVRDLAAGQVVRSHDIRRAVLVRQGQQTLMTVGKPGDFQISLRVEALQDGRMGEQIRLKNPDSGRLISGTVVGPNAVRGL